MNAALPSIGLEVARQASRSVIASSYGWCRRQERRTIYLSRPRATE